MTDSLITKRLTNISIYQHGYVCVGVSSEQMLFRYGWGFY